MPDVEGDFEAGKGTARPPRRTARRLGAAALHAVSLCTAETPVSLHEGFADLGDWRPIEFPEIPEHTQCSVIEERVNIIEDYRAAFKHDPPSEASIATMFDADNTGESATAYVDDIGIHGVEPKPAPREAE